MTICMSDILCVTNRTLCPDDFLQRLEQIAAAHPGGIILREKDLSRAEYMELARQTLAICRKYNVTCILHSFTDVAIELGADALHMPLSVLRDMNQIPETKRKLAQFTALGASCHSVEDALEAEKMGCTYITAGHIFATDCKKGLPGRGLDFLKNVCESVSIPVYAIGGIHSSNIAAVRSAGAKGACVMSGLMQCEDVKSYFDGFGSD